MLDELPACRKHHRRKRPRARWPTSHHDPIDHRRARGPSTRVSVPAPSRPFAASPVMIGEARIILLVDGMAAFRTAYEGTEHARLYEMFLGIAADGRQVGVHVVISADRPGALPVALAAQVQRRVVLRLADPNDYSTFGLPSDVLDPEVPTGAWTSG
jgi:S-DNA-T family DNA segregation ATPase FtsK/SpoIIIE